MNNFYDECSNEIKCYRSMCEGICDKFNNLSNEEVIDMLQAGLDEYETAQAQMTLVKNNMMHCMHTANKAAQSCFVPQFIEGGDMLNVAISSMLDAARDFNSDKGKIFDKYIGKKVFGGVIEYVNNCLYDDASERTVRKYGKAVKIYNDCMAAGVYDEDLIVEKIQKELGVKKLKTAREYLEKGLGKMINTLPIVEEYENCYWKKVA